MTAPLRRKLEERGRVPASLRIVPLADAPADEVVRLTIRHIGGTEDGGRMQVRRAVEKPELFRPSVVLLLDGQVAAAIIVEEIGPLAMVRSRVVAPEFRGGWANSLMLDESVQRGLAVGIERVGYESRSENRDTLKLAERSGGQAVRVDELHLPELPDVRPAARRFRAFLHTWPITFEAPPAIAAAPAIAWEPAKPAGSVPSHDELYRLWERQHWSASAIDFGPDRADWIMANRDVQQRALHLGGFAEFYHAETTVTDALAAYLTAAPERDQKNYLATQIADEARHAVFFRRFCETVLDLPARILDGLKARAQAMTPAVQDFTFDALDQAARKLRAEPASERLLVEAVTLYHLLVEATVGIGAQRTALARFKAMGMFPGLRKGLADVMRDEVRHVQFGVRFLRDAVARNPDYTAAVMDEVTRRLPGLVQALTPTPPIARALEAAGLPANYRLALGMESLDRKLRAIGVKVTRWPAFAGFKGKRAR